MIDAVIPSEIEPVVSRYVAHLRSMTILPVEPERSDIMGWPRGAVGPELVRHEWSARARAEGRFTILQYSEGLGLRSSKPYVDSWLARKLLLRLGHEAQYEEQLEVRFLEPRKRRRGSRIHSYKFTPFGVVILKGDGLLPPPPPLPELLRGQVRIITEPTSAIPPDQFDAFVQQHRARIVADLREFRSREYEDARRQYAVIQIEERLVAMDRES